MKIDLLVELEELKGSLMETGAPLFQYENADAPLKCAASIQDIAQDNIDSLIDKLREA